MEYMLFAEPAYRVFIFITPCDEKEDILDEIDSTVE